MFHLVESFHMHLARFFMPKCLILRGHEETCDMHVKAFHQAKQTDFEWKVTKILIQHDRVQQQLSSCDRFLCLLKTF